VALKSSVEREGAGERWRRSRGDFDPSGRANGMAMPMRWWRRVELETARRNRAFLKAICENLLYGSVKAGLGRRVKAKAWH